MRVVGQTASQSVFEVMGRQGELTKQQDRLREHYSQGLAAYRSCRWEDARSSFNAALAIVPEDGPSLILLRRVDHFQNNPPPAGWDGSWQMEQK